MKKALRHIERLMNILKKYQRSSVIIIAFIIIGVGFLMSSRAATPSSSIEAESGALSGKVALQSDMSASNGGSVRFGNSSQSGYRRFFSEDASWNKTISQLGGELTSLKNYATRLWDYGGGTTSAAPEPGTFYLQMLDYSIPIYDIRDANTTARVYHQLDIRKNITIMSKAIPVGGEIPWNTSWKPATGHDSMMSIVDYEKGISYDLWRASQEQRAICEPNILGVIAGTYNWDTVNQDNGYNLYDNKHLCIGGLERYDNLYTAKDDATDPSQATISGRGMGINKLALVVRADEVKSGNIGHALPLTTSNPMFGPLVDNPANGYDRPGAGTTKGFWMKPATRLEHTSPETLSLGNTTTTPATDEERAKTIPSGMRFGIRITDEDITNWLNQRGYTGAHRTSAATFARAFRDYGAIVAETGGWGIGIETEGAIGPAKSTWAELGLYDASENKSKGVDFRGLITRDNLYVVKPPN